MEYGDGGGNLYRHLCCDGASSGQPLIRFRCINARQPGKLARFAASTYRDERLSQAGSDGDDDGGAVSTLLRCLKRLTRDERIDVDEIGDSGAGFVHLDFGFARNGQLV